MPVALCSAELATTVGGGMYRWVREAFGSRWGFLAVWCDWSENIVWFPTVLVFLATTAAYVINPDLSQNKAFLVPVMLVIFWAVTLSSLFGSLKSARWTGVGVIIGTAVPTAAIIVLGLWWTASGKHSEIPFHATAIMPAWHGLASLVYAAGIVVAFAGMEIGGFYSHVTRNVKRTYPGAVLIAAVTVATLSILGSVAIAMVVPGKQIELAGGIMQAVSIFFAKLGISSLIKPFGVLVIIGVLCGLASWSMGPAEGMRRVAADGHLSPWWGRTNRRGAPTTVLLLQATLGSVLALALIFVNNINTYYWMLTALVAQTFLVMYFLMYIAVIRLRITQPDAPRPFKIPGGKIGLALIVGAGIIGAAFTFFLGFIPATHLSTPGHHRLRHRHGLRHDRHRRHPVPPAPRPIHQNRHPDRPRPRHPRHPTRTLTCTRGSLSLLPDSGDADVRPARRFSIEATGWGGLHDHGQEWPSAVQNWPRSWSAPEN